jgi:hypothetical protein
MASIRLILKNISGLPPQAACSALRRLSTAIKGPLGHELAKQAYFVDSRKMSLRSVMGRMLQDQRIGNVEFVSWKEQKNARDFIKCLLKEGNSYHADSPQEAEWVQVIGGKKKRHPTDTHQALQRHLRDGLSSLKIAVRESCEYEHPQGDTVSRFGLEIPDGQKRNLCAVMFHGTFDRENAKFYLGEKVELLKAIGKKEPSARLAVVAPNKKEDLFPPSQEEDVIDYLERTEAGLRMLFLSSFTSIKNPSWDLAVVDIKGALVPASLRG